MQEVKHEVTPRREVKTEARILANALKHFCDYGYNGTSVREITAAAEVTKPTLYYYFKNKEELFTKVSEDCFKLILTQLSEIAQQKLGFEDALMALFNTIDKISNSNPLALKFIHTIAVVPQRGIPDVGVSKFVNRIDQIIKDIVARATANGECNSSKSTIISVLLSALVGLYTKSIMSTGSLNDRAAFNMTISSLVYCSNNADCFKH